MFHTLLCNRFEFLIFGFQNLNTEVKLQFAEVVMHVCKKHFP